MKIAVLREYISDVTKSQFLLYSVEIDKNDELSSPEHSTDM